MISEELEFQISQYVDADLSDSQRLAVDEVLKSNPTARQVLSEYRQLNVQLTALNSGPDVDWDRLSKHLSGEIHRASAPVIAGRISNRIIGSFRLRIAAAVLLIPTAWIVWHHFGPGPIADLKKPVGTSIVYGPAPEVPAGPAVEDVEVKPSVLAQRNDAARYGGINAVVQSPSKVVISAGLPPSGKHPSHLH